MTTPGLTLRQQQILEVIDLHITEHGYPPSVREIGTAVGPLVGKIWRLGAMGYNAMKHKVLLTLGALEACLTAEGFVLPKGAAVPAALAAWEAP